MSDSTLKSDPHALLSSPRRQSSSTSSATSPSSDCPPFLGDIALFGLLGIKISRIIGIIGSIEGGQFASADKAFGEAHREGQAHREANSRLIHQVAAAAVILMTMPLPQSEAHLDQV